MSSRPGKYRATIRDLNKRHAHSEQGERIEALLARVKGEDPPALPGLNKRLKNNNQPFEVAITNNNCHKAASHCKGWSIQELKCMISLPDIYPNLRTRRPYQESKLDWEILWDSDAERPLPEDILQSLHSEAAKTGPKDDVARIFSEEVNGILVEEYWVTEANKTNVKKHIEGIKTEEVSYFLAHPERFPNLRTRRVGPQQFATWTLLWDGKDHT